MNLVTGATGLLGSHIVEQLVKQGQPVRALARKSSDTRFLESLEGVELAWGDIVDAEGYIFFFSYAATLGVPAILLVLYLMFRQRRI